MKNDLNHDFALLATLLAGAWLYLAIDLATLSMGLDGTVYAGIARLLADGDGSRIDLDDGVCVYSVVAAKRAKYAWLLRRKPDLGPDRNNHTSCSPPNTRWCLSHVSGRSKLQAALTRAPHALHLEVKRLASRVSAHARKAWGI